MSSEDDEESFGAKFGQRQPPLSLYIKGILERYPDGQIFKVTEMTLFKLIPFKFKYICLGSYSYDYFNGDRSK